jgi:tRNA(Arg) A34 adenosine deaminase TadA|tara:strand:- start:235 stop:861 length:627 start_codon:yes stop_codon:yes gene_type:complete
MNNYDINNSILTPVGLRKLIDNILKDKLENDKIHKINITYEFILELLVNLKITLSKYEYSLNLNNNLNSNLKRKTKHLYYLEQAANYAKYSELVHKHGCVIVYNDTIISYGHNKKNNSLKNFSIHAEVDAINRLNKKYKSKKIISNCSLYVVRIRNGFSEEDILKMSKPCIGCASKINKIGIKKVYYSVDNDYVNDFIYGQIIKCFKC